jgi:co-chaperonin GroES (HSP10)
VNRRPIGDRILVKELEDPAGDIWIPSMVAKRGAVIEIGSDVQYIETGDEILFVWSARGVIEFRHEAEQLIVMPEAAVLVVLDRIHV